MTAQRETLLCRYRYDPLDRVVNCAPFNQDAVQRFYRKNRLATEIQGQVRYSVFEHESQLMAQQQQREAGQVDCALLATDLQRSVLHTVAVGEHQRPVYAPYGHRSPESGLSSLLGFNGERRDPVTGHYLLGNGYRAFNPVLMRFNSPDSFSPFGKGGVNAYAYCLGDPINLSDQSGHIPFKAAFSLGRTIGGRVSKSTKIASSMPRSSRNVSNTLRASTASDLIAANKHELNSGITEALVKPGPLGEIQQEIYNMDVRMLQTARNRHSIALEGLEAARKPVTDFLNHQLPAAAGNVDFYNVNHPRFRGLAADNPEIAGRYVDAIYGLERSQARMNFANNNYLNNYPTPRFQPPSREVDSIRK